MSLLIMFKSLKYSFSLQIRSNLSKNVLVSLLKSLKNSWKTCPMQFDLVWKTSPVYAACFPTLQVCTFALAAKH